MAALEKTKQLLRLDIPLALLVKNEDNPNKMSAREFDLLIDNLERTGLTDAILARPLDYDRVAEIVAEIPTDPERIKAFVAEGLQFRIVGGHHRFDGASFLGIDPTPVTVIMDPEFDEEQEKFQLVRMNMIRGRMDPQAFYNLYNKLATKYSDEILQDAFGFAEEAEFKKLIEQTAKALPDPKLQKKFKDAAAEIKTIDGLSKLLNQMFTQYGDTLPYGYMIVDYGGQRSMWIRVEKATMDALDILGIVCADHSRTMDDVLGGVVRAIAKGELNEFTDAQIDKAPKVPMPKNLQVAPTKDNLAKVAGL